MKKRENHGWSVELFVIEKSGYEIPSNLLVSRSLLWALLQLQAGPQIKAHEDSRSHD